MSGDTQGLEVLERRPAVDTGRPPLLFVHGLGHGAWCWEHWQAAAAEAGFPTYAVSLRGHGRSPGRLRTALLREYVDDVVATAAALPRPAVLVGHSMGGLVVQQALARYAARAAVLVAPVPAHPALASLAAIARRHPLDALRIVAGGSLPLRPDYLFHELDEAQAQTHSDRCHGESAVVQYQLLMHRPARPPLGSPPVLVLATPDDRLVPIRGVRSTAARYGAEVVEFPGMGHDLMLDARWREPLDAMVAWLETAAPG
ncbi:alpha/beta fold hydrolase [Blastococcus sp. CT_GayMR16]|uniref:alpha/beta hydrolase n=1 Tax=Blastococcus sp. CT_GayMR16 TaxID=2559607 RepID=UPI001074899B|nr:alpha/beta fold hydrolase [Blastococcus sp. CT_GayMR16]TFV88747.1 alpha/beta fold hydrolase [Blastococcus sp. CT_GayMR16]